MFNVVSLVVFASVFASVAHAYWVECHPGAYCAPQQALVAQRDAYKTPDDCGAQCLTLGATYKYFSYVPSSGQCLCTTQCDSTTPNAGANSYCLQIDYKECWPGQYCQDASMIIQNGTYGTPQLCADQCWVSNSKNNYFNLMETSGQCQCLSKCSSLVTTQSVGGYSINGAACTVGGIKNLRA
jgi:hypothetical protein